MASLIDRIIRTLNSGSSRSARDQAILDAAFIFEKSRGHAPAGWSQEVILSAFSDADIARLKSALVEFIRNRNKACWSLGKSYDPALKPIYIEVLRRDMDADPYEL